MVSLSYFRCERSHVEINGMEQNMLREDQALPIRGLALRTGRQNQVTSTKRFIRGVTVFIKH